MSGKADSAFSSPTHTHPRPISPPVFGICLAVFLGDVLPKLHDWASVRNNSCDWLKVKSGKIGSVWGLERRKIPQNTSESSTGWDFIVSASFLPSYGSLGIHTSPCPFLKRLCLFTHCSSSSCRVCWVIRQGCLILAWEPITWFPGFLSGRLSMSVAWNWPQWED